jgi:DNA helicase-2/ATP-dependent DNA helicase PcrA
VFRVEADRSGAPVVDDLVPAEIAACWAGRRRFVVEWAGPVPAPSGPDPFGPPETDPRPPWEVGVGFEFRRERLAGLLARHAVDARSENGARFLPAELALVRGARPPAAGGADVELPDGRAAFLDGGPLAPHGPGPVVVVPVPSVEAGRLEPLLDVAPTAELAPDQLAAVAHAGGGARIIAPAGSGKTRVLTERARLLLAGRRVPAELVTLVAFNVRAAEEMRHRTPDLPALHIRTLNSLGLAIVNGGGPFPSRPDGRRLSTIDEPEVRRILDKLVRFGRRAGTDPAAPWLEALSAVRLGLRDPAEVEAEFGGDVDGLADVVPRYRDELARRGALDFDEQIVAAIERLLTDPEARRRAQQACRVLLVDEFQDLAPAHLLLVRLLSAPGYDCFGVGDDDQTIYGYVGASPDWLVRFDRWFPGAADHPLEVNYRCPPTVVAAASNVLTRNRHRVAKQIRPAPGRVATATDLVVHRVDDPVGATCSAVEDLVAGGADPASVAVLTRVNVTLLPVQLRLAAAGIPTTAPVDAQLLTRSGVRAALAWLALAASARHDTGALPTGTIGDAARRPPRGLSPRLVEWMDEQRSVDGLRRLAGRLSSPKDADKVEAFAADVELLAALVRNGADTAAVLRAVSTHLGLGAAMDTLDRSRGTVDRSAHGDDLAALEAVAHLHPDPAGFGAWLRRQLTDSGRSARSDGVQLATVHRVKGREWPHVVVHDASAGLLPHRLAEDIEEERRVFHVALTRSSVGTVVVGDAAAPSPFLAELESPGEPPPELASPRSAATTAPGARRTAGATAAASAGEAAGSADGSMVDALKTWRRDRSRKDGVPAYVVLPDKAIDDIARHRPTSIVLLSRCHGIGPAKLERYGDEILAVLDSVR